MSSNDDQPVTPTRIHYDVCLTDNSMFRVQCTDFREDAGYMRFMDGPIPVGLVPITHFKCAYRVEPKP